MPWLLRVLLVCICSSLKSVLQYKFIILIRTFYICVIKDVRIRGCFSKPKPVREQKKSGKRCCMDLLFSSLLDRHVQSCFLHYFFTGKRKYEGRTESHEQLFFACELGTADEGDCGGRWNQLLCYP